MEQQPIENVLTPPVTLNIIVPPPILNNTLAPTSPTNVNQPPMSTNTVAPTSPTNINSPPIPTNIIPATSPTNVNPPTNIINQVSPTSINPPPIPINTASFAPDIPLQSIPQMPPLGPAPAQLPPLAHPPPTGIPTSYATMQETTFDSTIPVQTQMETLSLNSSLEPMPTFVPQSIINTEFNGTQELVDGNSMVPIPSDATANGESSLVVPGEEKPGLYLE